MSARAAFGCEHDDYLFPSTKRGRPLSGMAMDMLLRRLNLDVTVHGFRSSFREWCGELSTYPREVAEAALAHVVGDATERAYRRSERAAFLLFLWAASAANWQHPTIKKAERTSLIGAF
jgi:integrase